MTEVARVNAWGIAAGVQDENSSRTVACVQDQNSSRIVAGVQDENSSRGKLVQSYLRQADAVWLVSNIRRAVNDKSTKDMMPPSLRQRLLEEGRPGALAFVATQTDVLVRVRSQQTLGAAAACKDTLDEVQGLVGAVWLERCGSACTC